MKPYKYDAGSNSTVLTFDEFTDLADDYLSPSEQLNPDFLKLHNDYLLWSEQDRNNTLSSYVALQHVKDSAEHYAHDKPGAQTFISQVLEPVDDYLDSCLVPTPLKLHFVILEPLSDVRLEYLKSWSRLNPEYSIYIWTDSRVSLSAFLNEELVRRASEGLGQAQTVEPFTGTLTRDIIQTQDVIRSRVTEDLSQNIDFKSSVQEFLTSVLELPEAEIQQQLAEYYSWVQGSIDALYQSRSALQAEGIWQKDIKTLWQTGSRFQSYYFQELIYGNLEAAERLIALEVLSQIGGVVIRPDALPSIAPSFRAELGQTLGLTDVPDDMLSGALVQAILNKESENFPARQTQLQEYARGGYIDFLSQVDQIHPGSSGRIQQYLQQRQSSAFMPMKEVWVIPDAIVTSQLHNRINDQFLATEPGSKAINAIMDLVDEQYRLINKAGVDDVNSQQDLTDLRLEFADILHRNGFSLETSKLASYRLDLLTRDPLLSSTMSGGEAIRQGLVRLINTLGVGDSSPEQHVIGRQLAPVTTVTEESLAFTLSADKTELVRRFAHWGLHYQLDIRELDESDEVGRVAGYIYHARDTSASLLTLEPAQEEPDSDFGSGFDLENFNNATNSTFNSSGIDSQGRFVPAQPVTIDTRRKKILLIGRFQFYQGDWLLSGQSASELASELTGLAEATYGGSFKDEVVQIMALPENPPQSSGSSAAPNLQSALRAYLLTTLAELQKNNIGIDELQVSLGLSQIDVLGRSWWAEVDNNNSLSWSQGTLEHLVFRQEIAGNWDVEVSSVPEGEYALYLDPTPIERLISQGLNFYQAVMGTQQFTTQDNLFYRRDWTFNNYQLRLTLDAVEVNAADQAVSFYAPEEIRRLQSIIEDSFARLIAFDNLPVLFDRRFTFVLSRQNALAQRLYLNGNEVVVTLDTDFLATEPLANNDSLASRHPDQKQQAILLSQLALVIYERLNPEDFWREFNAWNSDFVLCTDSGGIWTASEAPAIDADKLISVRAGQSRLEFISESLGAMLLGKDVLSIEAASALDGLLPNLFAPEVPALQFTELRTDFNPVMQSLYSGWADRLEQATNFLNVRQEQSFLQYTLWENTGLGDQGELLVLSQSDVDGQKNYYQVTTTDTQTLVQNLDTGWILGFIAHPQPQFIEDSLGLYNLTRSSAQESNQSHSLTTDPFKNTSLNLLKGPQAISASGLPKVVMDAWSEIAIRKKALFAIKLPGQESLDLLRLGLGEHVSFTTLDRPDVSLSPQVVSDWGLQAGLIAENVLLSRAFGQSNTFNPESSSENEQSLNSQLETLFGLTGYTSQPLMMSEASVQRRLNQGKIASLESGDSEADVRYATETRYVDQQLVQVEYRLTRTAENQPWRVEFRCPDRVGYDASLADYQAVMVLARPGENPNHYHYVALPVEASDIFKVSEPVAESSYWPLSELAYSYTNQVDADSVGTLKQDSSRFIQARWLSAYERVRIHSNSIFEQNPDGWGRLADFENEIVFTLNSAAKDNGRFSWTEQLVTGQQAQPSGLSVGENWVFFDTNGEYYLSSDASESQQILNYFRRQEGYLDFSRYSYSELSGSRVRFPHLESVLGADLQVEIRQPFHLSSLEAVAGHPLTMPAASSIQPDPVNHIIGEGLEFLSQGPGYQATQVGDLVRLRIFPHGDYMPPQQQTLVQIQLEDYRMGLVQGELAEGQLQSDINHLMTHIIQGAFNRKLVAQHEALSNHSLARTFDDRIHITLKPLLSLLGSTVHVDKYGHADIQLGVKDEGLSGSDISEALTALYGPAITRLTENVEGLSDTLDAIWGFNPYDRFELSHDYGLTENLTAIRLEASVSALYQQLVKDARHDLKLLAGDGEDFQIALGELESRAQLQQAFDNAFQYWRDHPQENNQPFVAALEGFYTSILDYGERALLLNTMGGDSLKWLQQQVGANTQAHGWFDQWQRLQRVVTGYDGVLEEISVNGVNYQLADPSESDYPDYNLDLNAVVTKLNGYSEGSGSGFGQENIQQYPLFRITRQNNSTLASMLRRDGSSLQLKKQPFILAEYTSGVSKRSLSHVQKRSPEAPLPALFIGNPRKAGTLYIARVIEELQAGRSLQESISNINARIDNRKDLLAGEISGQRTEHYLVERDGQLFLLDTTEEPQVGTEVSGKLVGAEDTSLSLREVLQVSDDPSVTSKPFTPEASDDVHKVVDLHRTGELFLYLEVGSATGSLYLQLPENESLPAIVNSARIQQQESIYSTIDESPYFLTDSDPGEAAESVYHMLDADEGAGGLVRPVFSGLTAAEALSEPARSDFQVHRRSIAISEQSGVFFRLQSPTEEDYDGTLFYAPPEYLQYLVEQGVSLDEVKNRLSYTMEAMANSGPYYHNEVDDYNDAAMVRPEKLEVLINREMVNTRSEVDKAFPLSEANKLVVLTTEEQAASGTKHQMLDEALVFNPAAAELEEGSFAVIKTNPLKDGLVSQRNQISLQTLFMREFIHAASMNRGDYSEELYQQYKHVVENRLRKGLKMPDFILDSSEDGGEYHAPVNSDDQPGRMGFEVEIPQFTVPRDDSQYFRRSIVAATEASVPDRSEPLFAVTLDQSYQHENVFLIELVSGPQHTAAYNSGEYHQAARLFREVMKEHIAEGETLDLTQLTEAYNSRLVQVTGKDDSPYRLSVPEQFQDLRIRNTGEYRDIQSYQSNLSFEYRALGDPFSGIQRIITQSERELLASAQAHAFRLAGQISENPSPVMRAFLTQFLYETTFYGSILPDSFNKDNIRVQSLVRSSPVDAVVSMLSNEDIRALAGYVEKVEKTGGDGIQGEIQRIVGQIAEEGLQKAGRSDAVRPTGLEEVIRETLLHAVELRLVRDKEGTITGVKSPFALAISSLNLDRESNASFNNSATRYTSVYQDRDDPKATNSSGSRELILHNVIETDQRKPVSIHPDTNEPYSILEVRRARTNQKYKQLALESPADLGLEGFLRLLQSSDSLGSEQTSDSVREQASKALITTVEEAFRYYSATDHQQLATQLSESFGRLPADQVSRIHHELLARAARPGVSGFRLAYEALANELIKSRLSSLADGYIDEVKSRESVGNNGLANGAGLIELEELAKLTSRRSFVVESESGKQVQVNLKIDGGPTTSTLEEDQANNRYTLSVGVNDGLDVVASPELYDIVSNEPDSLTLKLKGQSGEHLVMPETRIELDKTLYKALWAQQKLTAGELQYHLNELSSLVANGEISGFRLSAVQASVETNIKLDNGADIVIEPRPDRAVYESRMDLTDSGEVRIQVGLSDIGTVPLESFRRAITELYTLAVIHCFDPDEPTHMQARALLQNAWQIGETQLQALGTHVALRELLTLSPVPESVDNPYHDLVRGEAHDLQLLPNTAQSLAYAFSELGAEGHLEAAFTRVFNSLGQRSAEDVQVFAKAVSDYHSHLSASQKRAFRNAIGSDNLKTLRQSMSTSIH